MKRLKSVAAAKRYFLFLTVILVLLIFVGVLAGCNDTSPEEQDAQPFSVEIVNGDSTFDWHFGDPTPTVERDGYAFDGWYFDADFLKPIPEKFFESPLYANERVYVKWRKLNTFVDAVFEDLTVVYDGNQHSISVKGVPEGANVSYDCAHTYTNAGEYPVVATITCDGYETKVLRATLTIKRAKVLGLKFNGESVVWDNEAHSIFVSGSLPAGVSVEYTGNGQTAVGVHPVTAKFNTGNNYEPIADMTANLVIEEKICTLTFVNIDGSKETRKIGYGKSLANVPLIQNKRGYSTVWSVNDFGNIRSDMTVRAVAEPIDYSIVYRAGENVTVKNSDYTVESDTFELPLPVREHYNFLGWFEHSSYIGEPVCRIEKGSIGDRELFAKWSAKEYSLTYITGGGLSNYENPASYSIESEEIILMPIVRPHYEFDGWFADADFNTPCIKIAAGSFGNRVFYAKWKPKKYTIEYIISNGKNDSGNPDEYTVSDCPLVLSPAQSNDKRAFCGWYYMDSGKKRYIETISDDLLQNYVLYAEFETLPEFFTVENIDGENVLVGFDGEKGGNEIIIPVFADIQRIAASAFNGNATLKSLIIECESLRHIDADAFYGCVGLEKLVLPKNITELDEGLLKDCASLEQLTIPFVGESLAAEVIYPLGYLFSEESKDGFELVSSKCGVVGQNFENYARYIPASLKRITVLGGDINAYAFWRCSQLLSIDVKAATAIGEGAFANCASLTYVVLSQCLQSVASGAFNGCRKLSEIYFEGDAEGFDNLKESFNLSGVEILYYSEQYKPGCWHYVQGIPTVYEE